MKARWKLLILLSLVGNAVLGAALFLVVAASNDTALADLALMHKLSSDIQSLRREMNDRCPPRK